MLALSTVFCNVLCVRNPTANPKLTYEYVAEIFRVPTNKGSILCSIAYHYLTDPEKEGGPHRIPDAPVVYISAKIHP